jgi:hypothetical protein
MAGTAPYNRRPTAVKRRPAPDRLLVELGPHGEGHVLVLTAHRSLPELTRGLRDFCRAVLESPSWQLGEGGGR